MSAFVGFAESDFAAYEVKKWSSNVYTLERMKVKEKLQAIGQAVQGVFGEAEANVQLHLSDEFPNIVNGKKVDGQWLYYCRNSQACAELARFLERTELQPDKIFNLVPQDKHIVLGLELGHEQVKSGLMIHPGAFVDRRNLAAKLHQSWHRERFIQLLAPFVASTEQASPLVVHFGFEGETRAAADITLADLEVLAEQLPEDDRRFVIWQLHTPAEAIGLGQGLAEHMHQLFAALAPIYQFAAWSRENDQIAVGEKIRQEKAEQRRNTTGLAAGDKVKFLSGLFVGKAGVVQGVDSRAQVKVQVGPMAVTIAGSDLQKI